MGKKRQLKVLRQIASQLPAMNTTGIAKTLSTGKELIKQGILTTGEGQNKELVDPNKKYVQSNPVAVPVNHTRRIKHLHSQLGVPGIKAYVSHVRGVMEKAAADAKVANPVTEELHADPA
jgi:hypothetical protein